MPGGNVADAENEQPGVADTAKDAVNQIVDAGSKLVETAVDVPKSVLELALSEVEKIAAGLREKLS